MIFALLMVVATAFAAPVSTRMSTVLSWFDQGQEVTWAEIKGQYSGRCFDLSTPADAAPHNLVYMNQNRNNGPGFPEDFPQLLLINRWADADKQHSDYYDNPPPKDWRTFHDALRSAASQLTRHFSNMGNAPTFHMNIDFEPNGRVDVSREFRKFNDYIVTRDTNLIEQYIPMIKGQRLWVEAEQPFFTCYFFKKVDD